MTMIEWNMPWILLLALQPLIVSLLRKHFEQKHINTYVKKDLQAWVVIHDSTSLKNKYLLRKLSYYLAWLLFAIAAAGPRIAEDTPDGVNSRGSDIMIVLDISQSMQATDLTPNRLRHAYNKINYIIENMPDSRIGIIAYAAKPHLYVPLTYDKRALHFYLKNLMFLIPPSQGSRALPALNLAGQRLLKKELPNSQRTKSIILITDADSSESDNSQLENSFSYFSDNNLTIFSLVVASKNGEAVPAFKDGWLNSNGSPVISRPRTQSYQRLSENNRGILKQSNSDNSSIASILNDVKSFSNNSENTATQKNWHELFYAFLLPAILLIFINMFPYKLPTSISFTRAATNVNLWLVIISIITFSFVSRPIIASQLRSANNAYSALTKHDYVKSRELYSTINGFDGRFGEAVSSYRLADYSRAIRLFEQAVLLAESPQAYTKTLYNLGNSYFQAGNYALAISNYEAALLYQPTHQASLKNLEYSKKALLAIEKRKELLAITTRSGRGPRSARAADDIVISNDSSVSLDGSESPNLDANNSSINKKIVIPEFIILRGLEFAKKSQNGPQSINNNPNKTTASLNINQLNRLQDNQSILWRRIFEIEEGYPAPLDQPDVIPGILPW